MNREIERKFLVNDNVNTILQNCQHHIQIIQGYISKEPSRIVRIRHIVESYGPISNPQNQYSCGVITIKTKNSDDTDAGVNEFEYRIPSNDCLKLLESCYHPLIHKIRHIHMQDGHKWEIDVFSGHKAGLIVAEIELQNIGEFVPLPEWIGEEVTGRPEYSNANM